MSYERSKAPLALMEQIIMILVFALASAVCLQAFVYSNRLSEDGQLREVSASRAQTVIEHCKAYNGDLEQVCAKFSGERKENGLEVSFPEDNLRVSLEITESTDYMEKAVVSVWQTDSAGDSVMKGNEAPVPIYTIDTAWQKEGWE
ncbi:MAG: hypothetical protein J1F02_11395 [Lachnospiraceae bacterium]|nr:hypothetical protein [Lachnospiraceae bacterium]